MTNVLYKFERYARRTWAIFLLGFGGGWFALFGYGLILERRPFALESIIGTAAYVVVACILMVGIIKGGKWFIEITDDEVIWYGPFSRLSRIRHDDVEWFERLTSIGAGDAGFSHSIRVRLRSGEEFDFPQIGDEVLIFQLLITKWEFRGIRSRR